jgi:uncharacterized protein YndB with AHSA1/START domain
MRTGFVAVVLSIVASAWALPESGRTLSHSVILEAPAAEVWAALTTAEGIKRTWAVALAEVDFRLGGTIRTNYNAAGEIGDESTITHHILSFEPERMLSMRTDAPASAPEEIKLIAEHGWVVIRLEPVSPTRTRLTETGMGYGEGPLWDKAYAFFEKGNEWTLEHMRKSFQAPDESAQVASAWELVAGLAGGEWISENKGPDGGIFRVRGRTEWGPGRKSLVSRGWLGDASGMFEHGSTQIWLDGPSNQVRYHSIHETGSTATGSITLIDDQTIEWDWPEVSPSGKTTPYIARMAFDGPDRYRFTLDRVGDGGARATIVTADFRRVTEAPAEFLILKPTEASR